MNPIEQLLSNIEFVPISDELIKKSDDMPYVTHEGVLDIGGVKIQVYQLSNGQRVISEGEIARVLGMTALKKLGNNLKEQTP